VKSNQRNAIDRNDMRGNNRPNACLEAGDVVCKVPPGTGILLLATDGSRVESNRVTGNRSLGIGLGNYCVELEIAAADCAALDIEPSSDLNRVTGNRARGNGARPAASVPSVFAVDLAWDTTGSGNCWRANLADRTFPASLPACR
jgi:nitrous oxidase accessory protein NosD